MMTVDGPVAILDPGKAVLAAKNFGKETLAVRPEAQNASRFSLGQNYPNQFNPTTTISFDLPRSEGVSLGVYNTLGELVQTLVDGRLSAGRHYVSFDGTRLASGIYFYRLQTPTSSIIKKMLLVR